MSNSTLWWQGTADDDRLNCTAAQADKFSDDIDAQLNYGQASVISRPFIVNVTKLGLPSTAPNGVVDKNVAGAVITSPREAAYGQRQAYDAVRAGGPTQGWAFFISVGAVDINVALALATPDFAIIPSGMQSQGGGFQGSPVTVVNPPAFPPKPLIPTP